FKDNLPILEDLLDVRPQLTRLRIDNREFLFNAESKRVVLSAHHGAQISARNNALSSGVAQTTNELTFEVEAHKLLRVMPEPLGCPSPAIAGSGWQSRDWPALREVT